VPQIDRYRPEQPVSAPARGRGRPRRAATAAAADGSRGSNHLDANAITIEAIIVKKGSAKYVVDLKSGAMEARSRMSFKIKRLRE